MSNYLTCPLLKSLRRLWGDACRAMFLLRLAIFHKLQLAIWEPVKPWSLWIVQDAKRGKCLRIPLAIIKAQ